MRLKNSSRVTPIVPAGQLPPAPLEVNLAEAKKGATVAVKVTDMLSREVLVVK